MTNQTWTKPHISKVYEALSAIADKRIEINGNNAICHSTSGNKYYDISFDPSTNSIMSNDNSAYYTGTISYPMIAFLMLKGTIKYDPNLLPPLANIKWKEVNQKFKNDYDQSLNYILAELKLKNINTQFITEQVSQIYAEVCKLSLNYLGPKKIPPAAY